MKFLSILFAFILLSGVEAIGQNPEWVHMPNTSYIANVYQTKDHIWVNDQSMLIRIPKKSGSITHWDFTDKPLSGGEVKQLMPSPNGDMYCWSDPKILHKNVGDEWQETELKDSTSLHTYVFSAVDDKWHFWWKSFYGNLIEFDGEKWISHQFPTEYGEFGLRNITAHKSGLWITTNIGTFNYQNSKWTFYGFSEKLELTPSYFLQFMIDDEGTPRLLYNSGIYRIVNGEIQQFENTPRDPRKNRFQCFYVNDEKDIWLGTSNRYGRDGDPPTGAHHFNGDSWKFYGNDNSELRLNLVDHILCDQYGDIWFFGQPVLGSDSKTIIKKSGNKWHSYDYSRDNLKASFIAEVFFHKNLVIGYGKNEILTYNGTSWNRIAEVGSDISAMCLDKSGNIYAKCNDGIRVYNLEGKRTKTILHYKKFDGTGDNILVDNEGNVWADYVIAKTPPINSPEYGVVYFDGNDWVAPADLNAQGKYGNWSFVTMDTKGVVWVANSTALYSYKNGNLNEETPFAAPHQAPNFAIDKDGHFWFNSYAGSLVEYDGNIWHTHDNPYIDKDFTSGQIRATKDGSIWLFNGGLYQLKDGKWRSYSRFTTDMKRLFSPQSFNIHKHGNIWMPAGNGVFIFRPGGVIPMGVDDEAKSSFETYPNPFADKLNIVLPEEHRTVQVEVLNMAGKLELTKVYRNSHAISLDLSHLSKGPRIIQIKADDKHYSTKVLKVE